MPQNIIEKILAEHLVEGEIKTGETIRIRVDQILTQDATGTLAYLQFEALNQSKIKVPLAVSYIDHNTVQLNQYNPDDHLFLQTAAAKYGAYFSKAGNGICHQVHLERFAEPGKILLGSDSHTSTAGGMGSLAIGVGGLDIAAVMAGESFELKVPEFLQIKLSGQLARPWITAMDVILEILRRLTVKGGLGKILEYSGPGVDNLSLSERATITNMGAELGATTSIFPSDKNTRTFLKAQKRNNGFRELKADEQANYNQTIEVDLNLIELLVSQPHSPDNVISLQELSGQKVDQVCIGSCTNSSYQILHAVSKILKGKSIHPNCSLVLNPGSKQVFEMLAQNGYLADIIASGARVLEASCGPCIGMGQTPGTGAVSVRTYNRNFKGRSGNPKAKVYLCNPLAAAVIALKGELIDPREANIELTLDPEPKEAIINDNLIIPPAKNPEEVEVIKGPNIKAVPLKEPLEEEIEAEVLLKLGDNITTDDILPGGVKILPLRSNIPAISEFIFYQLDKEFATRAKKSGSSWIVGGNNYGQGSSREHAALAPMYLGIKGVIAKSFARIHRLNLINFGLLPLQLENPDDYQNIEQGDKLTLTNLYNNLSTQKVLTITNKNKNIQISVLLEVSEREEKILKSGGLLPFLKNN